MRTWLSLLAIAGFALLSGRAPAQPAPRPLAAPVDTDWLHAQTGTILSYSVAGLKRFRLDDLSSSELDVMAGYLSDDSSTEATIYLFRPTIANAGIWFDRAQAQMFARKELALDPSQSTSVQSFALPEQTRESGLMVVYPVAGGRVKSTGLAVLPVNQWLVSVRVSSTSLQAEQLKKLLGDAVSGIRFPKSLTETDPAAAMRPCAEQLTFRKKAKQLRPDMSDVLMQSLMAAANDVEPSSQKGDPAGTSATAPNRVIYCRDGANTQTYAMYRAEGDKARYWLALGDAGTSIEVAPTLSIEGVGSGPGRYGVTLRQLDQDLIFAPFKSMPDPEQALDTAMRQAPTSAVSRGEDKTVTVSSPSP